MQWLKMALYEYLHLRQFLQTHATSYDFYSSVAVHCKGESRKSGNHTPFPMIWEIRTETSSQRTLKIMSRNLNETVRSWIQLQVHMHLTMLTVQIYVKYSVQYT